MGGLIAADGSRIRFKLPVLAVGCGDAADCVLPDTLPLHCLFVITPAGPAIRSFAADATQLNDQPVAAALLKHGDVVCVGPHRFEVEWQALPLESQIRAESAQLDQVRVQIAREREALAHEKAAARARIEEVERRHEDANAARGKARAAAARMLKRARAELAEARQTLEVERELLAAQQAQVEEKQRQIAEEMERCRGEIDEANRRTAEAWAGIAESQQELARDRAGFEQEQAAVLQQHAARIEQAEARERDAEARAVEAGKQLATVQAEIAGLEQRANHARMVLEELEQQRQQKARAAVNVEPDDWSVPLGGSHDTRSADQLLMQLRQQEHELGKERQRLAVQLQHAAMEREHLQDQKALVAEQVRRLEEERRQWAASETQTIAELEHMAKALAGREAEIAGKAQVLARLEADRRGQQEQLAQMRKGLEDWQKSLAAREHRFLADRQTAEKELGGQRERLSRQEHQVGEFFHRWDRRYSELCGQLRDDLRRLRDARLLMDSASKRANAERDRALAALKAATSRRAAVEETRGRLIKEHGPAARRMLRKCRKRWEDLLNRLQESGRQRCEELDAAARDAAKRLTELPAAITEGTEQVAREHQQERHTDAVRAFQSDRMVLAARGLRTGVNRIAAATETVASTEALESEETEVVPLEPAA